MFKLLLKAIATPVELLDPFEKKYLTIPVFVPDFFTFRSGMTFLKKTAPEKILSLT